MLICLLMEVTPTTTFYIPKRALWHWRIFPCMHCNCRRGATVHFSCDEGYELQGSKSISCLRVTDSYVGWSDDRPICRGKAWHGVVRLCIIYEGSPHVTPTPGHIFILWCTDSDLSAFILCTWLVYFLFLTFFIIRHFILTGLTLTFG